MNDIIGKKWLFFLLSGLLIVPGIFSLVKWGLKPSIDFSGGSVLEIQVDSSTNTASESAELNSEEIKKIIQSQNIEVGSVQKTLEQTYLLRLKPINKDQNNQIQKEISKKFGDIKELRFETVGPTVGKETTENALKAVVIASLAIVLYVAYAFRQIPKPYSSLKFGICAVVALIHDVLVVVGLFSIFGHFLKVEVDSLFMTALLTIMGFSVHDTIVVFDRIRENLRRMPEDTFQHVVNVSILQTMVRSLSTSLTVLFTLFALLLFGGETVRWFIVALLIGVTSGTYSSVFNAAPLLVVWEEWGNKKVSKS
jgi:preprotein translocase subunit SecF